MRDELVEKLARRGWYVVECNLVIGDPAKGKRVRSPILRDARLAALHPEILAVSLTAHSPRESYLAHRAIRQPCITVAVSR